MFSVLRNALLNVAKRVTHQSNILTSSSFHLLARQNIKNSIVQPNLLVPVVQNIVPCCGFKVMGKVRRRCKDCYLVRRNERMFVICKTHPRHKQMSMVKDPKNTWILSHATQSKVRPWWFFFSDMVH